ncbi:MULTISPECIES: hypothetical protein [unclassified Paenibacillus]|uniref:hypothetical protein n=1 Tax=unclassified Paenibacillus TaxID=185978 RepID=UPI00115FBE50|nr:MULTISPECIES: hypothetical protein [unclassified Paenibacillus]QLG38135.1 hypothetical protein HW560_08395 [Paenibacillus sp. E222]
MNFKRKLFGSVLSLALILQVSPVSATEDSTYDPLTESTTITKEYLKKKAIREGKELDVAEYESKLENAKTQSEIEEIMESVDDYSVHTEIEYQNKLYSVDNVDSFDRSITIMASPGDTRLRTEYSYGAQTLYGNEQGDLTKMGFKLLNIGAGMTHPYVGAFMTVLDLFIKDSEYDSYKSTIIRTMHDYVIIYKYVDVYQWNGFQYIWAPMATSTKKNSSAQLNVVYYKNSVRYTPSNYDLGQISGQAGDYFYDEARLTQLAKNTLSPLYYGYQAGTVVPVNVSGKFKY